VKSLADEVGEAAAGGRGGIRSGRGDGPVGAFPRRGAGAREALPPARDELPYTTAVVIDDFKMEGAMRRIAATIYVDRQGHKAIVIGREGATLKRIGTEARVGWRSSSAARSSSRCAVKVKSGWADSESMVRQWGYE